MKIFQEFIMKLFRKSNYRNALGSVPEIEPHQG